MLIISRKDAESILIRPAEDVNPKMTLAELFSDGPIEITVFSTQHLAQRRPERGRRLIRQFVGTPP